MAFRAPPVVLTPPTHQRGQCQHIGIGNRQLGEHLAIDLDPGGLEPGHHLREVAPEPFDIDELDITVSKALQFRDILKDNQRMRAELDRSNALRFDLKQGEGGLVDLEFLLQALVLLHAGEHPALCEPRDTPGLLRAVDAAGLLPPDSLQPLLDAHALMVDMGLDCTLDQRPRLVPPDDALESARAAVREACAACGFVF